MKTLYGVGAETFDEILKSKRDFEFCRRAKSRPTSSSDDPEASVVKFVNQIIREAIVERRDRYSRRAAENDIRIRYRSTASCTKWQCRHSCACCTRPSFRD